MRKESETLREFPWLNDLRIEASPTVVANTTCQDLPNVMVVDRSWHSVSTWRRPKQRFDVVFTVFGPAYGWRRGTIQMDGCADVVSLFGSPVGVPKGSFRTRLRSKVRTKLARRRFADADLLVVEAEHVARGLAERWGVPRGRIVTVPNVLNEVFRDVERQMPVRLLGAGHRVLCYVTRPYPHKNLQVLGDVGLQLLERHGLDARFALTLTREEWGRLPVCVRNFSINVGPLTVAQLPALYESCEAAFFPSLLEAFSVTPLEALASGCPLIASDREFVRDIAGPAATYFDPLDPIAAADAVARVLTASELRDQQRMDGLDIVGNWPRARDRARRYLELIDKHVEAGS